MDRPAVPATLTPVANKERIQSLDVVRGFALIGILLMSVEFFNRRRRTLLVASQPVSPVRMSGSATSSSLRHW